MRLERSQNTKRNIIVLEIDKISGILLPFAVRTMIIHLIGAEYLGLTGLFYSIIQMLNLAEMGFGAAITYSMYKPIAENDSRLIGALLRFYAKIYRFVGIAIAVLGLIVMIFLPYLVNGDPPQGINMYLLYLIYLGDSCLNCFLFPERKALLSAYQRNDLSGRMHIITQTIMYAAQIVSICLARDFYLYALTVPVSTLLYSLLCARQAKKAFGEFPEVRALTKEEDREIKKQVAGLLVRKVASLSRNAFDSMFISAFLGLGVTAVYGNYYYIMDAVVMILAVVKTSMAGGVGNSIAMESPEKNLRDMHTINFLFMCVSGWCAVCLLCLYQPFMEIWVGDAMKLPFSMAVTFAVYFYVLKMSDIRTLYAESVGLWWQTRYLSVIEAVANLVMNWLFISALGLFGIILATMISYLAFNFIGGAVLLYRYYFKGFRISEYFLLHLKYIIITAGVAVVTWFASSAVPVPGIPGFIIKAAVCLAVPGVLYFLIWFKTREFKEARPFIKVMLKR